MRKNYAKAVATLNEKQILIPLILKEFRRLKIK